MLDPAKPQRLLGRLMQEIRDFFRETGALEVFTPTIVPSPGMEPDIRVIGLRASENRAIDGAFLHTSPEFAIKATLHRFRGDVFTIARAYRDEVCSTRHFPEFHLLEWYRRDAGYERLMNDVQALMHRLIDRFEVHDTAGVFAAPFPRIGYLEAFERFAGIDASTTDPRPWHRALAAAEIHVEDTDDQELLESVAYSLLVEPRLAALGPCFLVDYPVRHAVLSRRKPGEPSLAERVEFYLPHPNDEGVPVGLEIANGFSELLDPIEQRARFEAAQRRLDAMGKPHRPMPEAMLQGIGALDATAGMALGVDRLAAWIAYQLHGERWSVADFYLGTTARSADIDAQ